MISCFELMSEKGDGMKEMLRKKIFKKNYVQVLFVFIAFALMAAIGGFSISNTLQKASSTAVTIALDETEKTIEAYLREPKVAFRSVYSTIQDILDKNESQKAVHKYLVQTTDLLSKKEDDIKGFITVYGYIRDEFIAGVETNLGDDYVPQQRPWYQLAVRSKDVEYTAPYVDANTGLPIITLAQELYGKNGDYYGVLALDLDISWLMGYAESLQFVDSGYGMIINQYLHIIAHPQNQYRNKRLQDLGNSYVLLADMLRTKHNISAERIQDTDGTTAIVFFKQIFNEWYVGVVMPTGSYYSDLYLNIMLLASLGFILACILSYILLRLSSQKLRSEEESRSKSSFLAMMSHEMRTPMNAIIGMTNIAKSEHNIEKKDYALNKIEDASTHLLGVINNVLDMSKIEADKLELNPNPFNFRELIEKVVNIINFRVEENHQDFKVIIDESIPRILVCDDQRIAQVITNLLSNAVKFTPEYGTINLSVKKVKDENDICEIQFEVADTGVGISEEQQSRIFKPFEQADFNTTRQYGGTGLGLALTKRIVELMGGNISVSSAVDEGSTFTFTVLTQKLDEKTEVHIPDKNQAEDSKAVDEFPGCHVLLAEDVEINREIVLALLEPTLLKIDCAKNGVEAVRMFRENPEKYDIVFMDIQMPEMDGFKATRSIRSMGKEKSKTIPIIAMTANVFKEDIDNCLKSGMNDHIGKPLDFDAVLNILKKYLIK